MAGKPPALDRAAIRRGYARFADRYDAAAVFQREVARRMAERLQYVKLAPARVLDLGCGTGTDFAALAQRYPDAQMIGCDFVPAMLQRARARVPWMRRVLPMLKHRAPRLVCADAEHLPLRAGSVGLAWSNQMLHLFDDPLPALREVQRVLEVGGLLMFSSLGPDTLMEFRRAFDSSDAATHVHGFIDMHDLGDMLMASGFAEPVMDMEMITLTYDDLSALTRDLRHSGAANAVAGRHRGLTGRGVWQGVRAGYEALRRDGRLPATFEVVYGHAWKAQPKTTADGRAIVHFDLPRRVPSRVTT